jgi:hypothetical protein
MQHAAASLPANRIALTHLCAISALTAKKVGCKQQQQQQALW